MNISRSWLRSFKSKTIQPDPTLWLLVFILLAAGMVMVYSSSFIFAQEKYKDGLHFFKRHLIFMGLGGSAFLVGWRIDLGWLKKHVLHIVGFVAFTLLLTLIPGISHRAGGAARWISLGGLTFQPAEFAKIAIIFLVALQVSRKINDQSNFRSGFLTYFIGAIPLYALLLKQPDFGTTALCLGTTFLMLVACGVRARYLMASILSIVPAAAILIFSSPYRRARVLGFLDPWSDPANKGFQVIQSYLAFFHGKIFGVGLGNSREKLFYLPEAHNDFIFAVVGEELGLVGVLFFLSLYTFLVFHGIKIVSRINDPFKKALASGITSLIGLQAFFNMAVVLGLLPTKGLPLPMISYGGTALITILFMLGLLAQLSESSRPAK